MKRLQGMLPICASCKKVRDDDGYWKQIESYISDHSNARFSHSLCPEVHDQASRQRLYAGELKEFPAGRMSSEVKALGIYYDIFIEGK
ncbi:MAG: hypothetical protein K8R76_12160 [Candidatus Aegiribacteria sp.]|nr:hypothetical protein [Candidatus Aegiribacteria sp.]